MITSAVVVTYNPDIRVLRTLISQITSDVKSVVIVDNGSNNIIDIQSAINDFRNIEFIPLSQNKGIGFAQNRGIENVFKDKENEAVILFDHDSHPSGKMIPALANELNKLLEKNIPVGAVGPIFQDPRTDKVYPIPVYSGFSLKNIFPPAGDLSPVYTSFLIASGCLIPKNTIDKIGLMNEAFFIDYIDIEWSFRVHHGGLQLYTCPSATMHHQIGDERLSVLGREISIHSPVRRYYLARNSILMTRISYIDWKYKVREMFYTVSRVLVYIFLVKNRFTYLKYIFRGWKDGILGRTGPFVNNK